MGRLKMDALFEAQEHCAERCPMFGLSDPEQIARVFDWLNTPSVPYLDADGNDTSGLSMTYQNAILRCSAQVLRGACETPVEIR